MATHTSRQTVPNFERFRNEKDTWKLLDDQQVVRRMKLAMGTDIEKFWDCTQCTGDIEHSGHDLFTTGMLIALPGDRCSFFDLNIKSGKCCLGWLINNTLHVYGAKGIEDVPKPVAHYLEGLSGSVSVNFEKPNRKPLPVAKPKPVKKNLNLKTVTGTYERASGRFSSSELKVLALPDGKIKFSVFATNGGQTGGVDATVPLVDNRAVYKVSEVFADDTGYIELKFNGRYVQIGGTEGAFCGAAVTLTGIYEKNDDRQPAFPD